LAIWILLSRSINYIYYAAIRAVYIPDSYLSIRTLKREKTTKNANIFLKRMFLSLFYIKDYFSIYFKKYFSSQLQIIYRRPNIFLY
jgi:hypothetical protein